MPKTGLSGFVFAKYTNTQGVISYTGYGSLGEAVSVSTSITTNDNGFYSDNHLSEKDETFQTGTVTFATKDLTQAVTKAMLGVVEQALPEGIPGITDTGAKQLIYDKRQQSAQLGYGYIEEHLNDGVTTHRAVMIHRVAFSIPSNDTNTRGEQIEWQTPSVTGTIMRDESENEGWMSECTFTTKAQAVAYLRWLLGDNPIPTEGT